MKLNGIQIDPNSVSKGYYWCLIPKSSEWNETLICPVEVVQWGDGTSQWDDGEPRDPSDLRLHFCGSDQTCSMESWEKDTGGKIELFTLQVPKFLEDHHV